MTRERVLVWDGCVNVRDLGGLPLEDTTIVEVSTPELDDVVRLEDRYGREGTTEP